ncbi:hypothetical protein OC835_005237 [Tilletia horrida]|nr:hypothetical protein OC835_005237 [Tilletia horrida]
MTVIRTQPSTTTAAREAAAPYPSPSPSPSASASASASSSAAPQASSTSTSASSTAALLPPPPPTYGRSQQQQPPPRATTPASASASAASAEAEAAAAAAMPPPPLPASVGTGAGAGATRQSPAPPAQHQRLDQPQSREERMNPAYMMPPPPPPSMVPPGMGLGVASLQSAARALAQATIRRDGGAYVHPHMIPPPPPELFDMVNKMFGVAQPPLSAPSPRLQPEAGPSRSAAADPSPPPPPPTSSASASYLSGLLRPSPSGSSGLPRLPEEPERGDIDSGRSMYSRRSEEPSRSSSVYSRPLPPEEPTRSSSYLSRPPAERDYETARHSPYHSRTSEPPSSRSAYPSRQPTSEATRSPSVYSRPTYEDSIRGSVYSRSPPPESVRGEAAGVAQHSLDSLLPPRASMMDVMFDRRGHPISEAGSRYAPTERAPSPTRSVLDASLSNLRRSSLISPSLLSKLEELSALANYDRRGRPSEAGTSYRYAPSERAPSPTRSVLDDSISNLRRSSLISPTLLSKLESLSSLVNQASDSPAPKTKKQAAPRLPMPHKRASIILIGMRGVGKTTLGLIASTHYGRRFIDCDLILNNHTGMSAKEFVASYGWEEYMEQEASVLESIIAEHPFDAVISCGGSAVESERVKSMLLNLRMKNPIVLVLRERDHVAYKLLKRKDLQRWTEEAVDIWVRRDPFFWILSSHVFFNLTQPSFPGGPTDAAAAAAADEARPRAKHPLSLKHVEQSFIRLLDFMSGEGDEVSVAPPGEKAAEMRSMMDVDEDMMDSEDRIWSRVVPLPDIARPMDRKSVLGHGRTSYLSLTFPDLRKVDPAVFEEVLEGVDAIELRADLLDCLTPASREVRLATLAAEGGLSKAPQIDFADLALQIETARALCKGINLPMIFTIRTSREGGRFFDDRDHASGSMESAYSEALYFLLLGVALSMGVEILDLELAWSPELTKTLAMRRGHTKIMCSYHDLVGALRWDSPNARALYERASSFDPDYVELIGTALSVEQNWHLLAFASAVNAAAAKDPSRPPLVAINMGQIGQPSRPFQPVLSPVSHPLQPSVAAPGQLSLQEMNEIAGKLGLIKRRKFVIFSGTRDGHAGSEAISAQVRILRGAIRRIGLPYEIEIENESGRMTMLDHFRSDACGGGALPEQAYEMHVRLFDIVAREDLLFRMTEDAVIVGGADVVCLTEPEADGEKVRQPPARYNQRQRTPGDATDRPQRCIAHHSLPRALEKVIRNHLSPLNKTSAQSSAVIVLPATETWDAGLEIGLRSAARAVQKLGFGYCAIVVCGSYAGSKDIASLPSSLVQPPRSKLQRVLLEAGLGSTGGVGGAGPAAVSTRFGVHPLEALSQMAQTINAALEKGKGAKSELAKAAMALVAEQERLSGSGPGPGATKQERDPIRPPSAVLLVGGTVAQHRLALESIMDNNSDEVAGATAAAAAGSEPGKEGPAALSERERTGLPLPAELWNSPLGGVCVSIPTIPTPHPPPPTPSQLEPQLLKRGWMSVSPALLAFERFAENTFEPLTRKRAPRRSMRAAFLGMTSAPMPSGSGFMSGLGAGSVDGGAGATGGAPAGAGADVEMVMEGSAATAENVDKGKGKARDRSNGGSDHQGTAAETLAGMRFG